MAGQKSKRVGASVVSMLMAVALSFAPRASLAQEYMPYEDTLTNYHNSPRYRESESHPLRLIGYMFHPIGWAATELIFRPLSHFASSTRETSSVLGYREPYDYRRPECFSASDSVPDCRATNPYNYDYKPAGEPKAFGEASMAMGDGERRVFFPDVNFDFNKRKLSDLGRGKARQIADLLGREPGLQVVLEGHADMRGGDKYNEKLGMDRAHQVRTELMKLGVAESRVSTVTFGESVPIYAGDEDWARAVNRRVSVRVE